MTCKQPNPFTPNWEVEMGKTLVVAGVILVIAILVALVVFLTRRWRDKQLLKVNPLALQKKGLDRVTLVELDERQKEVASLRQTLGNVAGLLEQALGDEVVTVWGSATKQSVERALQAARSNSKE